MEVGPLLFDSTMDRKVIQQDRCFNARCHAMQSFRPCTYVCNTFEHVGGNMLECFNLALLSALNATISKDFYPRLMQ